jgi:hypothetical protein
MFDMSASLVLTLTVALFLQRPSFKRALLLGLSVGLAATVGRNHGVYGLVGAAAALLWTLADTGSRSLLRNGTGIAAGIVAGFLPVLLMMVLVPGFATAFRDSVLFLIHHGETNLPLPVPWPWRAFVAEGGARVRVDRILLGLFFIAPVALGAAVLVRQSFARRRRDAADPALTACAIMAIIYSHYAFAWADLPHLAQGIQPTIVALVILGARLRPGLRLAAFAGLVAASILVTGPGHPFRQCLTASSCLTVDVGGDRVSAPRATVAEVDLLRRLDAR